MKSTAIWAGALAAVAVSAAAWAADMPAKPAKDAAKPAMAASAAPAKQPAQPAMPAMTPEQQKMMEMYMKAGTPGPEHERLAKGVGTWDMVVTSWDAPGAPPNKEQGTAQMSMTLGGRVQVQTIKSQ